MSARTRLVVALGLALGAFASPRAAQAEESCAVCHGKEAREFRASIHARGGLTCTECHGGAAGSLELDEAHGDGLKALRDPLERVEACGGCHADVERMRAFGLRTDPLSLYWTSAHGAKLALDGDAEVATCTSCHGVHDVLPPSDPLSPVSRLRQIETCASCHADAELMASYGIPARAVDEFRASVHGRALLADDSAAAPTCTDCHGSHGAAPPRFADVQQVCGACHATVQEHFAASPHARDSRASVQCVSCHASHAVAAPSAAMFTGDEPGHCGSCHSDDDPGAAVARTLQTDVAALAATIDGAEDAVRAAGGRGLFLGAERGYLDEARGLLVRARAMTHSLSPDALDDVLNRGQGMVAQTMDGLATKNRIFRDRKIYTGIFLAICCAFAVVLWMYGAELRARGTRGGL